MYGDRNAKTTLNHRHLLSLLLLVVGGLGLAHAGYNVGVGRADITGPAAEVSPTQFTWHLPFYYGRTVHRTTKVGVAFGFPPKQFRPSFEANRVLFGRDIASYMRK
jgi:hypothetical protein